VIVMKQIDINHFNQNVFQLFDRDWALVTAGNMSDFNTMTISWGSMGILWNKKVITIYIRPTRHTYQYMEKEDMFTVSFYKEEHRDTLFMLGTKSGKDTKKIKESGLHPVACHGSVTFKESRLTFVCKKIYHYDVMPNQFIDESISKNYPKLDYHRAYIGEIVEVLES
jgi:flavin reductase (DIM6/NTAB) family NADH-FMN oxidoreductase RutF